MVHHLLNLLGTGKSFVIKSVVPAVKHLTAKSGQDLDKPSTLVLAPSATAAFLVNGKTIESGLHFNMSRRGGYSQGGAEKMTELAFQYEDLAVCVLEEVSMIGSNKFAVINYRMQNIALGPKRNEFMGGKSILAVGDFRQVNHGIHIIASINFFLFSCLQYKTFTFMKTHGLMVDRRLHQTIGGNILTYSTWIKR